MSASAVPIGPLYGSLYFATVISGALYGVSCMQTFFYYVHYRHEPLWMRGFVSILWALGTTHQALITAGAYKYIVAGLTHPLVQASTNTELIVQMLMTGLTAVLTEFFFIYRIYIFSKKNIVGPIVLIPATIYQFVSALVYLSRVLYSANGSVHVVGPTTLNDKDLVGLITSCMFASAGVDILIAIFLTYYLVIHQKVGLRNSVHILQRLTVLAVNSGIWTAIFALLAAILLQVFPNTMLFDVVGMPLCGMYTNTLLANLNSRKYIRGFVSIDDIGVDVSGKRVSGTKGDEDAMEPVPKRQLEV